MKKFLFILLINLLAINFVFAKNYYGPTHLSKVNTDNISIHGPTTLHQVKANSLIVYGPLQFNEIIINNKTDIFGRVTNSQKGIFGLLAIKGILQGHKIICNTLKVSGSVNVSYLLVKKETDIIGRLIAKDSKFHDININSKEMILDNVKAHSINIKPIMRSERQIVYLKNHSIISGDIKFYSGKGVLIIDPNVVIKGKVKGAVLQKNYR